MDVEGRSTSNGANVHIFTGQNSNDDNQRWYLSRDNNTFNTVIGSFKSGKKLDLNIKNSNGNLNNVQQWEYGGNANQRWIFTKQ